MKIAPSLRRATLAGSVIGACLLQSGMVRAAEVVLCRSPGKQRIK
jgi:hypothetical protein